MPTDDHDTAIRVVRRYLADVAERIAVEYQRRREGLVEVGKDDEDDDGHEVVRPPTQP
jgi:hypothetical protein